jgi:ABC-2 type transport system ATP-binding protein
MQGNTLDGDVLTFSGVSKAYRRRRGEPVVALREVGFAVGAGQIYGLLGPNGAGKTTLLKCALDLARADAGEIRLLGEPPGRPAARARVGHLPEDHQLPEHLTARQALDFVGRLCAVPAAERARRTDELLERVGLAARSRDRIRTYSKGMRQRLGLAQALFNAPRLLILDEPNEGLDPLGRADVKALLQALKAEGATVLISSHVLAELESL